MTRLGLVVGLFLAPVALGQPTTYTVPIVGRTPAANPVTGTGPLTEAVVLPPFPAQLDQTLAFGVGGGAPSVFRVADAAPTTVTNLPATVDAIATAPGVMVNGVLSTVVAISTGGAVTLGTLEANAFVARNAPGTPIPATTLVAITATPDGGSALFVSDGTNITRWDIDGSGTNLVATRGFTISANPTGGGFTDTPRVLVVDALGGQFQRGVGYVGGGTLGDIYVFDAQLDAGAPSAFDVALVSLGRLAPPITGLSLMQGTRSDYLLAANTQGLTVYDLTVPTLESLAGAFVLHGADSAGTLSIPRGVGATNLSASTLTPGGAIVVGNPGDRTLALLSWADVADAGHSADGGPLVVVDTAYDPRQGLVIDGGTPDGGTPDGGPPDAGDGGGGGNPGGGGAGPIGPGIPVDNGGNCAAVGGLPSVLPLLAMLGLLVLLRRRTG